MIKTAQYSIALLSLVFSSCIQVPLTGGSDLKTYKNVSYKSPKGFSTLKSATSDKAWINRSSGNSIISYRSECPAPKISAEDFLENLVGSFYSSTDSLTKNTLSFESRQAVRYKFSVDIEGTKAGFDILGFKKYDCLFLITHNGKANSLSDTDQDFESFLNNFKVLQ